MKRTSVFFIASIMPLTTVWAVAFPTGSNAPVSDYGLIQNVQNYSSNPFWTPNAPYNQRMPQPVYAQGAQLNAGECQSVVTQVVAAQCSVRDNCVGMRLNDIKPAIMVYLSRMPGANYVGACAGFIDTAFNDYVAQYGTGVQNTNFPTATAPGVGGAGTTTEFKIQNPYQIRTPQWGGENWYQEIGERAQELKDLQSQNGAGNDHVYRADMPKTIADLSFTERMENAKAGYEQWAPVYGTNSRGERVCIENCAYQTLNVESDEKRFQREANEAQQKLAAEKAKMDLLKYTDYAAWCKKMPAECQQEMAFQQGATGTVPGSGNGAPPINSADRQAAVDAIIQKLGQVIPK